jgi:alkanesulfonate monooxygenase SsuD/methylene tetrahydromethanopterin reductase-like flavin-dependent oxidoreductase (luciferase family)
MRDIRNYVFTEMAYPFIPPDETIESARVTLPNRYYDPEAGSEMYHKFFDIYRAADELGLDIMLNEHHSTATCLDVAVPLSAAIVARETHHARILPLGNPIANRPDPIRVAEEMAMIDVLSRGRLQCGFVRGVPMEVSPQNVTPIDMYDRFWEAADLIIKAWTTHDGPFNWEGEHFQARQVNIWPRPHQQPHPAVWVPTQSVSTGEQVALRGHNLATILTGTEGAAKIFGAFRKWAVDAGLPEPGPERVGYSGLMFVGENEREARAGGQALQWYLQHNKTAPQFMDVPGYLDAGIRARILAKQARGEEPQSPIAHLINAPVEELIELGMFFVGTPDQVVEQVKAFDGAVGGCDNLLMMMHVGTMSFDTTYRSLKLCAEEVLPRLRRELD